MAWGPCAIDATRHRVAAMAWGPRRTPSTRSQNHRAAGRSHEDSGTTTPLSARQSAARPIPSLEEVETTRAAGAA